MTGEDEAPPEVLVVHVALIPEALAGLIVAVIGREPSESTRAHLRDAVDEAARSGILPTYLDGEGRRVATVEDAEAFLVTLFEGGTEPLDGQGP